MVFEEFNFAQLEDKTRHARMRVCVHARARTCVCSDTSLAHPYLLLMLLSFLSHPELST